MFIKAFKSARRSESDIVILVEISVPQGGWDADSPTEERELMIPVEVFLEIEKNAADFVRDILADQIIQRLKKQIS